MEWTPRPLVEHLREQERHNVTVITVGSKYEVYVRSPASSHMQTLSNPFETLAIKWEVNIFEKKSSCVFILRRLFMRLSLLLSRYDTANEYITCEDTGCSPEDLPEEMNDMEKWREGVRDIRASGTTWWWWYIYIYIIHDFIRKSRGYRLLA